MCQQIAVMEEVKKIENEHFACKTYKTVYELIEERRARRRELEKELEILDREEKE